jgi:tRNA(fMet)-specific endonuclease VapC
LRAVPAVTLKLKELRPEGIALSTISLAELYEGIYGSRDPVGSHKILSSFLRKFPNLGIRPEICRIFGEQRARLRKEGSPYR